MPCIRFQGQLTASLMKVSELAPFHWGSVSGKSCPMSGRHSAPRMASVKACSATSPEQQCSTGDDAAIDTAEYD